MANCRYSFSQRDTKQLAVSRRRLCFIIFISPFAVASRYFRSSKFERLCFCQQIRPRLWHSATCLSCYEIIPEWLWRSITVNCNKSITDRSTELIGGHAIRWPILFGLSLPVWLSICRSMELITSASGARSTCAASWSDGGSHACAAAITRPERRRRRVPLYGHLPRRAGTDRGRDQWRCLAATLSVQLQQRVTRPKWDYQMKYLSTSGQQSDARS